MTIKEVEQYLEHFDISDTEENLGDSVPKAILAVLFNVFGW